MLPTRHIAMLLAVPVALAFGCARVDLIRWRASEGEGVVAAPLCAFCGGPYEVQTEAALALMAERCAAPFRVTEEGTALSGDSMVIGSSSANVAVNATPTGATAYGSGFASASSIQIRQYYWLFECAPAGGSTQAKDTP